MNFKTIDLPDGGKSKVPEDISLTFPPNDELPKDELHYLAYIPWDEKYLGLVPAEYEEFFEVVLEHLHARTTDVHTAICLPLLKKMLDITTYPVDKRLIYIALILHDSGWSKLSDQEIADSLSYSGLKLSKRSLDSKHTHQVLGSELSEQILNDFMFDPPLSEEEKKQVCEMVLNHDVTKEMVEKTVVSPELYLVSDADRLWSYTHENFWQDTVRKGVEPKQYLANLDNELDGYFYTEQGKKLARELLSERSTEVEDYYESA